MIKRKWPQRQHFAVLIAEKINRRFFNVIHILSESVPLIAIQANIVKTGDMLSLHFTKILDVYVEPEDDSGNEQSLVDEDYWRNKSGETLDAVKTILKFTEPAYENSWIKFNQNHLIIMSNRTRMIRIFPLKSSSRRIKLDIFHYGDDWIAEAISDLLTQYGISFTTRQNVHRTALGLDQIRSSDELLSEIAKLNSPQ